MTDATQTIGGYYLTEPGAACYPTRCTDGSVAAPEARGWCRGGRCVPVTAKTHVYDLGSRPWALHFLAETAARLTDEPAKTAAATVLRDLAARLTARDPEKRPTFSAARVWLDRAVAKRGIGESGAGWKEPGREKAAAARPPSTSRAPPPRPHAPAKRPPHSSH